MYKHRIWTNSDVESSVYDKFSGYEVDVKTISKDKINNTIEFLKNDGNYYSNNNNTMIRELLDILDKKEKLEEKARKASEARKSKAKNAELQALIDNSNATLKAIEQMSASIVYLTQLLNNKMGAR